MANRLANATSPYLLQHAENSVDWWEWGQGAFDEARRRDVPVLISIGYSTCHWCHVMARESFDDPVTAAAMNDGFVAVKVDREEHPDVDAAYLAAASAFTQSLGWPLTVFATSSGRAFHAGTYFPPVARGGMPAFRDVLAAVREAWTQRREQVDAQAEALAEALAAATETTSSGETPSLDALTAAAGSIAAQEDPLHGGFGSAPKFPVATVLRFLQCAGRSDVANRALDAMAASELRDPVDGGFFRYATGRDWTVPHYERMLTDNAQLLEVALAAGRDEVARGIAGFLLDVLRRDDGGFGAAQDSESWIDGVRDEGGYSRRSADARVGLEPPAVDGKVITGWNGLAIGALAWAGTALGEPAWVAAAERAARYVLAVNRRGHDAAGLDATPAADAGVRPSAAAGGFGRAPLVRASLDGVASAAVATAADIGLLADGLFALALATGEVSWASAGLDVLRTPAASDPVLAAQGIPLAGDESDGDLPSGAAALASARLTAWRLGAGSACFDDAASLVSAHAERALRQPFAFGALLRVALGLVEPPRQIVVVTSDPAGTLVAAARRADADVVAVVTREQARAFADAGFELFAGKEHADGVAYDCRAFTCRLPTSDPAAIPRER